MLLKGISLQNFRSYKKQKFEFSGKTMVVVGPNGAGKTNLLEAIYLLATGKSFRAELEEEMIAYGEEIARVTGEVGVEGSGGKMDQDGVALEVVLTRGEVGGEKVDRKKFLVNGVAKRMMDFVGVFRAVLFGPWDLDLITDSPSLRRRYLDSVLVQRDREYRRALLSYEKGLRQRNRLLERIRDEGAPRSQLLFWDKLLIKNGDYLTRKREEFLSFLGLYRPFVGWETNFIPEYERSTISETRIAQYAEEEVAAGVTLVGPHRDDVEFYIEPSSAGVQRRDLSKFGSRGEQRLAVLWLKLGELEFLAESGPRPVLLLDDILSELDNQHREIVTSILDKQQTIITTADEHSLEVLGEKTQVIRL